MEEGRQLEKFRTVLNYLRPFALLVLSHRTQEPRSQPHTPCPLRKKYGGLGSRNEKPQRVLRNIGKLEFSDLCLTAQVLCPPGTEIWQGAQTHGVHTAVIFGNRIL